MTVRLACHYLLQPVLNRRRVPRRWTPLGGLLEDPQRESTGSVTFRCDEGWLSVSGLNPRIWRVVVKRRRDDPYRAWSLMTDSSMTLSVETAESGDYMIRCQGLKGEGGITALLRQDDATMEFRFAGQGSAERILHREPKAPGFQKSWISCVKESPEGERYVGFGEKTGPLFKNGMRLVMWNTDDRSYGPDSDPLYQSCPLQIAIREDGSAHGLFFDNPAYSVFGLGGTGPRPRSFYAAEESPLCYFVMAGPTLRDVLQQFTLITGRYPLPPLWALGHQHSRWEEPESAERLLNIAEAFREHRIPCDVLYLDIGHMEGCRCFTWNRETFPDPAGMIKALHEKRFKAVAIVDPGLKRDKSWDVYQEGIRAERFCRDEREEVYHAPVWPGSSAFPDFFSDEVRAWWGSLFSRYIDVGVDGFWNDMNEPSLFTPLSTLPYKIRQREGETVFTHRHVHNLYGLRMAQASYEGLRKLQSRKRPFLMTRSGFAGIQRFASAWTGDNRSNFKHYRLSLPMLLNMGLSGQPMVGADIGGFWSHPSEELMARWIQLGSFYPYSRNHTRQGTPPQELWQFGAEVEEVARSYLGLRYSLLPYLYTFLQESCAHGVPLMRPVFLDFPGDSRCLDTKIAESEFLVGPYLLAAPVLCQGCRRRDVYLPASCRWYEWWTGGVLEGGQFYSVEAPLDRLPLFVRCGTVIPMGPAVQVSEDSETAPLELRVFPDRRIEGSLYVDDARTTDYERGAYSLVRIAGFYDASGSVPLRLRVERAEGSLDPVLGRHPQIAVRVFVPGLHAGGLSVRLNTRLIRTIEQQGDWLVIDPLVTDLKARNLPLRLTISRPKSG
jgi:alpha-glucosidase